MRGDIPEDRGQRPDPKGAVSRDRDVVLATLQRGEPQMASALSIDLVTEDPQCSREAFPRDVS